MMLWWMTTAALAGKLYVNGVEIGTVDCPPLAGQTFDGVQVAFDAAGNLQIVAPRYQIEVVDPATGKPATPKPAPAAATAAPAPAPTGAPTPPEGGQGIAAGRWWLVTEDNASSGHSVDVYVNGALVRHVVSGESQVIEDISAWLRPGDNEVKIRSISPGTGEGGTLYVYLGTGSNDSGTVVMDPPQVQYGVGASKSGTYERQYTITASP